MIEQRILLQIKTAKDNIGELSEEEAALESKNPYSEYFEWKIASYPISELSNMVIIESNVEPNECVMIDQLGKAVFVKKTIKELHTLLNKQQIFKWN
jgi:hypothetical protein